MTTETPPLVSLLPDDGRPTWQQVVDLFRKNGAGPPPASLRDEIVVLWSWARYGQALARRSIAPAGAAMMTETELKPCPFCGGEARIVEGEESAYVQCQQVKMHVAIFYDGDNSAADEVAEQWNRRSIALAAGWRDAFDEMLAALKLVLEVGLADEDGAALVEAAIYAAISKAQRERHA